MPRRLVFVIYALFLAACGTVSTSTPMQTLESTNTIAPPTATATITSTPTPVVTDTPIITPTSTPGSHMTVVPTVRPLSQDALNSFPRVTAVPASDSFPTLIPTMQPETISAELQVALQFRDLDAVDGRPLSRITRWKYGYIFNWLDENHLLLFPKVGEVEGLYGRYGISRPVVANLESKKLWVSPSDGWWSAKPGIFIAPDEAQKKIVIYSLDGERLKTYQGILTSVSPSGTKILINRNVWIDLISGKTVEFAWKEYCGENDLYLDYAIWSSDETQVYVSTWGCQIHYGNALTGESHEEAGYAGEYHGAWVLNDKYMLVQWNMVDDGSPGFLPLFNPWDKTYLNLNKIVDIPNLQGSSVDPSCFYSVVAPNNKYLWTHCSNADDAYYLIVLDTFKAQSYRSKEPLEYRDWSPNGKLLVFGQGYNNRTYSILPVGSEELLPLPVEPVSDPMFWWHPMKSVVAYLSKENKSLVVLDVETMSALDVKLPTSFCNYNCMEWHTSGNWLALKASDGSLWQLDYPNLETLEQLTPPGVYGFDWSPDGTKLAFTNHAGVFILEVGVKP